MRGWTCKWCGENIGFEYAELGYDFCPDCSELEIERSNKRREWAEYHPGEPCPEEELPPYRALLSKTEGE